jgi:thioredoxin reductase (NADPH)
MIYDLIIIWTGSAGYPAGMYASRYNIKNLIIWEMLGWALATSHKVDNYPGTVSAPGKEIMEKMREHALISGSEILNETVTSLEKIWNLFQIKTNFWKEFSSRYIILATGSWHKHLWVLWEEQFLWKWVSYCATCDGMFFRGKNVVVVWGWNTALTESLYLADICNKVFIVHRKDTFRAESSWIEQAKKRKNIEFLFHQEIQEISWWMSVEKVQLVSGKILHVQWVFVAIGAHPNTNLTDVLNIKKDEEWYILVDKRQETSLCWLYAAWDVTTNSNKFKQTIMSAAEWCLSANSVHEDIIKNYVPLENAVSDIFWKVSQTFFSIIGK